MVLSTEALPLLAADPVGDWILLKEVQCDLGIKIPKELQRSRIVFFERNRQLVNKPRLLTPQALVVPAHELELLGLLRVRPQHSQMSMIGAQKLSEHPSIKWITLRAALPKPIPRPIQSFGVDGIDLHPMIQQKIHNPALGLLYGAPKLYPLSAPTIEPTPKVRQPLRALLHLHLCNPIPHLIYDAHLMDLVGPIHSQIVSSHNPSSLNLVFPRSPNGRFALYRSSQGTTFY